MAGKSRAGFFSRRPFAAGGLGLLLAAVVLAVLLAPGLPGRRRQPSVVLVSIDSLRPDHLGCYGYGRDTSPCLDRLAREGALFRTVVSSTSWTLPAHAALFTGLPDSVHGCRDARKWLDRSRETLAEAFQAAGYRTAGFFAGPFLHTAYGFSQGFDLYHDCTAYAAVSLGQVHGQEEVDLNALAQKDVTNPRILQEVARWLEANPAGPRFLFIHLWDVHFDYIPPPPYDTMFDPGYAGPVDGRGLAQVSLQWPPAWGRRDLEHLQALYDGEIRWTDDTLGKLLEILARSGIGPDDILAVTADHGEAFLEHGLFGHHHGLFEEEIRIPLVIRSSGSVKAGLRIPHPVRILDIAPTLLDLAGLPPLGPAMGRSLVPLLAGGGRWEDEPAVAELFWGAESPRFLALRTEAWKLIVDCQGGSQALFDLRLDPGERNPLPEDGYPMNRIQALRAETVRKLAAAAARLPVPGVRDAPPLPAMTEKQLRAMKYLR